MGTVGHRMRGRRGVKYAFVYGGIPGAIVIAVITGGIAFNLPSHATSEWFGYLVMLTALSLIFVGVKRYRDVEGGGVIRFGRAFLLGLGMAAVAGLMYVAGWEIYLATSGRDVMADYAARIIQSMRANGASPSLLQAKTVEMRELVIQYRNPLFRLPMTFAEIFPVGLIVALVSAALLRNPRLLPDRRSASPSRPAA